MPSVAPLLQGTSAIESITTNQGENGNSVLKISESHKSIATDSACGLVCTMGPLCKESVKLIADTGAISTLASDTTVKESAYLSELPKEPIKEKVYYAGNDGAIVARYMIRIFLTTPEGIQLSIPVFVAEGLSEDIILLGCDVLKQLDAIIDVAQNVLYVSKPQNFVAVTETCQLKPHEASTVIVALAPLGITPLTRQPLPFTPFEDWSNVISNNQLHFVKNLAYISCVNHTEETLTIEQGTLMGTVGFETTHFVCTMADLELPDRIELFSDSHLTQSQQKALLAKNTSTKKYYSHRALHVLHLDQNVEEIQIVNSGDIEDEIVVENSLKYPWLPQDDIRLRQSRDQVIEAQLQFPDTTLTDNEQEIVRALIHKHNLCFSTHDEVGYLKDTEVILEKKDNFREFLIRHYPISANLVEKMKRELQKLESHKIIERGPAKCYSPCFVRPKPDGKNVRLLLDLRVLNTMISQKVYPLLCKPELHVKLACQKSVRYLSGLDVSQAYFSVPLAEESRQLLGLSLPNSSGYRLNRLPQGGASSMSHFSECLSNVLQGMKYGDMVTHYADDIFLSSTCFESHLLALNELLDRLTKSGLKLNLKKCQFCAVRTNILGFDYVISENGMEVHVPKNKIMAAERMQVPNSKKALRRYLGFANFLAQNLKNLRSIAAPLYKLAGTRSEFKWEDHHQVAFDRIKELLVSPAVLEVPIQGHKYVVRVDCSAAGMGCILSQIRPATDNSPEREAVIAYESKAFSSIPRFSGSSELELFGITLAVTCFRHYLSGDHFLIYTDNSGAIGLLKPTSQQNREASRTVIRLIERLTPYSFTLKHVAGKEFLDSVDFLSRETFAPDDIDTYIRPLAREDMLWHEYENYALRILNLHDEPRYSLRRKRNAPKHMQDPNQGYQLQNDDQQIELDTTMTDKPQENQTNTKQTKHDSTKKVKKKVSFQDTPAPANKENGQSEISEMEEMEEEKVDEKVVNPFDPDGKPLTHLDEKGRFIVTLDDLRTIPIDEIRPGRAIWSELVKSDIKIKYIPSQATIDDYLQNILQACDLDLMVPLKKSELILNQKLSLTWGAVFKFLTTGLLPNNQKASRKVLNLAENFAVVDGVLTHILIEENGELLVRPVLTEHDCFKVVSRSHLDPRNHHIGTTKLYTMLKKQYYCSQLYSIIRDFISNCPICLQKRSPPTSFDNFDFDTNLRHRSREANQIWYTDLKTMPESIDKYKYLLIIADEYSRFILAEPLLTRNSKDVTDALLKLIAITGNPRILICDADAAYTSRVFEIACTLLGIKLEYVPAFAHHFSFAETGIHLISQRLLSLIEKNNNHDWLAEIRYAVFGVNMTPNTDTHYTPYELYYGRTCNFSTDLYTLEVKPIENTSNTYKDYIIQIHKRINDMRQDIIQKRQIQRRLNAERQRKNVTKAQDMTEGTFCYVLVPQYKTALATNSRKFNFNYVGPLLLTRKHPDNFVTVCSLDGEVITQPIHIKRVRIAKVRIGQHYANTIADLVAILQNMPPEKQMYFKDQLESLKTLTDLCKTQLASISEEDPLTE